jgi:hypothetical protein
MKPYLKYFFSLWEDQLTKSCQVCLEAIPVVDENPPLPDKFLKWYEEGDFDMSTPGEDASDLVGSADSPIFLGMFSPRQITFSIEDAKRVLCS